MTNGKPYRLDHTTAAKQQIQTIAELARQADKLPQFIDMLKKAVHC